MIGRLPVLTYLNPLDANALKLILSEPKNALIKQYTKLFELDGIKLTVQPSVIDFIVEKAIEHKLGARGLRSICEAILTDAMFELPSSESEKEFVLSLAYAKKHLNSQRLNKLKAVS